jgi:proline iminopeptidase
LVDYWQIETATIIGHSWGALLALFFAIQNPGRVGRMLLVTPASVNSEYRNRYLEELNRRTLDLGIIAKQRDLLRSDLRTHHPDEFRQRVFQLSIAPFLKEPSKTIGVEPFQISHRARAAVWRSLGEYDLADDLSKLSVRALVIHGKHDPIPLSSSKTIAKLLGARLEVFENSGHMPFFEEPDRFVGVSEEFLRTENS